MNKCHEGSAEFLIPRGHAAELLELVEPLHLLVQLVLLLVIVNRLGAIRPPIRAFGSKPRVAWWTGLPRAAQILGWLSAVLLGVPAAC